MRANDNSSIPLDFSGFAEADARYRTILVIAKMESVRCRAIYDDLPQNGAKRRAGVCF